MGGPTGRETVMDDDLRICILGVPSLGGKSARFPVDKLRRQVRLALVALVLAEGSRISRDQLAERLWPGNRPTTWPAALRGIVAELREVVVGALPGAEIRAESGVYYLELPPDVTVDATVGQQRLAQARKSFLDGRPDEAAAAAGSARDLFSATLLPGEDADWIVDERRRLSLLASQSAALEAESLLKGSHPELAFEPAEAMLSADPVNEEGYRILIEAQTRSGHFGDALRTYERCRRVLSEELGASPSEGVQRAYLLALGSDAAELPMPEVFPAITGAGRKMPVRTGSGPLANISQLKTSFIGRSKELRQVIDLVTDPSGKVITIVGPGGCGKTRLSVEVAIRASEEFRDGAHFADLSPITDAARVPDVLVEVLRVPPGMAASVERLNSYLAGRHLLLVADNVEQVLNAGIFLADMAARHPKVHLLVTSREPLDVEGEVVVELLPLEVPKSGSENDLAALSEFPSVQLFAERARRAANRRVLSEESASVIAELVRRLEGLPLAIEIAAARADRVEPAVMLKQLPSRLDWGAGDARHVPERHRTLRSTLAWSRDLLERECRILFDRLSIFSGGCTVRSVERVANFDGKLGREVLSLLGELSRRSLLNVDWSPSGELRFTQLETVRTYALEWLTRSNDRKELSRQHAQFFAATAQRGASDLDSGHDSRAAMRWFAEEAANLQAALAWSGNADEVANQALSSAMHDYGQHRAYWAIFS